MAAEVNEFVDMYIYVYIYIEIYIHRYLGKVSRPQPRSPQVVGLVRESPQNSLNYVWE